MGKRRSGSGFVDSVLVKALVRRGRSCASPRRCPGSGTELRRAGIVVEHVRRVALIWCRA
jgi:hypothetical protein